MQPAAYFASTHQPQFDFHERSQSQEPDAIDTPVPVLQGYYPTPESNMTPGNDVNHQDLFADLQLPGHGLLTELVELFFDNVGHLFPCFHRKSFEKQIDDGVLQDACPLLLFAMCSIACRYHSDPAVQAHRQDWYDQAKLSYELTQRSPFFPLRVVQAVLILVFYSYTTGDFSAGCLCLGKVWKQTVTLGLNRMDSSYDDSAE